MLRDFLGQDKDSRGKLSKDNKSKWRERIRTFVAPKLAVAKRQARLKADRLANKYHLKAFDHALLAGMGCGLDTFVCEDSGGKLTATERRYFIPSADLPEPLQKLRPDRSRCACVWDLSAVAGRLEIEWGATRRLLVTWQDMGAVGWPSKYYAYLVCQIRGWFFPDPAHRRHDNMNLAVDAALLSFIKTEASYGSGTPALSSGKNCLARAPTPPIRCLRRYTR